MRSLSCWTALGVVLVRVSELRAEQVALADRVTQEMLAVFGSLNFMAVDVSAPGFIEASVSVARRGHIEASALGADAYLSMRREAGVAGVFEVFHPEFDEDATRRALTILGPVAAKRLMSRGVLIPDAARRVFTLSSGRVSKMALAGARDTLSGSSVRDDQATGYARVVSSTACDFCVMLAGNTYQNAYTALYSAGNRKRNKAPQPMGSKFHDHCKCTVRPLFAGELPAHESDRQGFMRAWAEASGQGIGFREFAERAGVSLGF